MLCPETDLRMNRRVDGVTGGREGAAGPARAPNPDVLQRRDRLRVLSNYVSHGDEVLSVMRYFENSLTRCDL